MTEQNEGDQESSAQDSGNTTPTLARREPKDEHENLGMILIGLISLVLVGLIVYYFTSVRGASPPPMEVGTPVSTPPVESSPASEAASADRTAADREQ